MALTACGMGVCYPTTCPSLWPHRTREKQRRRAASAKKAAIPPSWCQRVLYMVVMLSSTASSRAVCARSTCLQCRRAAVRSVNVPVASWMCSAVGDIKTCFLVREGTWKKGEGAHAPRERDRWRPACFAGLPLPKRILPPGASGKGGHGRPHRTPEPWPR